MDASFDLIQKYNVQIPRYTSYPTVPYWQNDLGDNIDWEKIIKKSLLAEKAKNGISLYIHLPFCEQLCTYCGCNKRITKNHGVEKIYINAILKEWQMYKAILGDKISIKEIHLGGGTPTFMSPENLKFLIEQILIDLTLEDNYEFSFEGHPNNTSFLHLKTLYDIGFRRVSFGVQDLDEKVQIAINRVQPLEKTKQVTDWAREIGYDSINFDLIYGLPFQTNDSIVKTIKEVTKLKPNRIAFYSYAHVPWTQKAQRAYDESDLPIGKEKYALYSIGKNMLVEAGYEDVGMDHFAFKTDSLLKSKLEGLLHRNFMGYTTNNTEILIGLGVSAISDVFFGYRQNLKTVESYYESLEQNKLPIFRGINLSEEDVLYRKQILNIACKGKTDWNKKIELSEYETEQLNVMQKDGLLNWENDALVITELGWSFLRNICAVFDKKMNADLFKNDAPKFSQAI